LEVWIKTSDRTLVEEIHQQVAAEYERIGSAQAAIDWLLYRSPWDSSLFENPKDPSFSLPPALTPIVKKDYPEIGQRTRQVRVEDLPREVAELVQSLFEVNRFDEYEHAGVALRLNDDTVIRRGGFFGGDITSWDPKRISDNDSFRGARSFLISRAIQEARKNPSLFQQSITLYYYHTHPYRKPTGFTETPVYSHTDGRTYTLTNETDAEADEKYLKHMTTLLRDAGFTGPITLEGGAVPSRKGKKDQLYIATYFPLAGKAQGGEK
jgi:hypothetical protein